MSELVASHDYTVPTTCRKTLRLNSHENHFMLIISRIVYFMLCVGRKNKDIARMIFICTIFVRDHTATFNDNHGLFYARMIVPVERRTTGQIAMGNCLKILARCMAHIYTYTFRAPLPPCADSFCISLDCRLIIFM